MLGILTDQWMSTRRRAGEAKKRVKAVVHPAVLHHVVVLVLLHLVVVPEVVAVVLQLLWVAVLLVVAIRPTIFL